MNIKFFATIAMLSVAFVACPKPSTKVVANKLATIKNAAVTSVKVGGPLAALIAATAAANAYINSQTEPKPELSLFGKVQEAVSSNVNSAIAYVQANKATTAAGVAVVAAAFYVVYNSIYNEEVELA